MKIRVLFVDPERVEASIRAALTQQVMQRTAGIPLTKEDVCRLEEEIRRAVYRWLKFNDCLTIEIDTEAETAVVLPVSMFNSVIN